jgi:hypothetical protein
MFQDVSGSAVNGHGSEWLCGPRRACFDFFFFLGFFALRGGGAGRRSVRSSSLSGCSSSA